MEQMERFCREKDIPPRILERFSFGLHHAEIGGLIARKWNFPEQLVQGIRHHHDPLVAPQQFKDVVQCVYLANAFCDMERGLLTFDQMEAPVVREFGIETREQCVALMEKLRGSFEKRAAGH
jgi:HD-like signal output (HDOD) protein